MTDSRHFDIIIIGGSYSGLALGMALGMALRPVLIPVSLKHQDRTKMNDNP